jgi:putative membrane protein
VATILGSRKPEDIAVKTWRSILWITLAIASQGSSAQAPVTHSAASSAAAAAHLATGATFIQQAAEINLTELELSKLARNNSTTPVIIKFSTEMIRDLTAANLSLKELADENSMGFPTTVSPEHAAMIKRLGRESGWFFETDYRKDMVMTEKRATALYQAELADINPELSSYAQRTLPAIEEHEKVAKSLTTTVGGIG